MYSLTHLKAILELLADKVEDDGVYARVDTGQVDGKIVHGQKEARKYGAIFQLSPVFELYSF